MKVLNSGIGAVGGACLAILVAKLTINHLSEVKEFAINDTRFIRRDSVIEKSAADSTKAYHKGAQMVRDSVAAAAKAGK